MKLAFRVHTVTRIHRIRWEQIEKPSDLSHSSQSSIVGIVKMEGRIILLLDFEKIVMDINPSLGFNADDFELLDKKDRSQKRIMIVEDSATLRAFLEEVLHKAGYHQLLFYENGALAWKFLEKLAEENDEKQGSNIQLIITDIEMPQMDGHQLTRKIKEHPILKDLPVVIFSSLITEELKHKGEAVGANAQISKPDYIYLAQTMDSLAL
jgi:two-component system chemotaxis response regulator CheV